MTIGSDMYFVWTENDLYKIIACERFNWKGKMVTVSWPILGNVVCKGGKLLS